MRYTAAICAALFVLMGTVSSSKRRLVRHCNCGGKYVDRGGARSSAVILVGSTSIAAAMRSSTLIRAQAVR